MRAMDLESLFGNAVSAALTFLCILAVITIFALVSLWIANAIARRAEARIQDNDHEMIQGRPL